MVWRYKYSWMGKSLIATSLSSVACSLRSVRQENCMNVRRGFCHPDSRKQILCTQWSVLTYERRNLFSNELYCFNYLNTSFTAYHQQISVLMLSSDILSTCQWMSWNWEKRMNCNLYHSQSTQHLCYRLWMGLWRQVEAENDAVHSCKWKDAK
jgi:hypothetical protein